MFFATPALCLRESFRQPFPIGKLASSATLNHVISHYLQKVGQYHKTVSHRAWDVFCPVFQCITFQLRVFDCRTADDPASLTFGDNKIARLLRLKRYEQPPPDYFENFLSEFRRRQRDELLRQPSWRIWFKRAQSFALQDNVRSLASTP